MPYDLRIPGWMPETELKILELAARTIPPGGRMVEVGSFCGRSSWCWARSVDPSVQVTCLDIWNPTRHPFRPPARTDNPANIDADYGVAASEDLSVGTLANFERYTRDCPNITAIQGSSPYDFQDWREPLDLVFLDGLHNNPVFWDDLNFWFWKLKPGGLCCGDDFSARPIRRRLGRPRLRQEPRPNLLRPGPDLVYLSPADSELSQRVPSTKARRTEIPGATGPTRSGDRRSSHS